MGEKQQLMEEHGINNEREWNILSKGINIGKSHKEPSDITIERLNKLDACFMELKCGLDKNTEKTDRLMIAFYGDPNDKDALGIYHMTRTMYDAFNGSKFTYTFIFKFIGLISAIFALAEIFKRLK